MKKSKFTALSAFGVICAVSLLGCGKGAGENYQEKITAFFPEKTEAEIHVFSGCERTDEKEFLNAKVDSTLADSLKIVDIGIPSDKFAYGRFTLNAQFDGYIFETKANFCGTYAWLNLFDKNKNAFVDTTINVASYFGADQDEEASEKQEFVTNAWFADINNDGVKDFIQREYSTIQDSESEKDSTKVTTDLLSVYQWNGSSFALDKTVDQEALKKRFAIKGLSKK